MTWDTDAAKVTHAVSCFQGTARDIWKRKERSIGVNNISWEGFEEFMRNAISDPDNRTMTALQMHERAYQKADQTVQEFVFILDEHKDELGYADN